MRCVLCMLCVVYVFLCFYTISVFVRFFCSGFDMLYIFERFTSEEKQVKHHNVCPLLPGGVFSFHSLDAWGKTTDACNVSILCSASHVIYVYNVCNARNVFCSVCDVCSVCFYCHYMYWCNMRNLDGHCRLASDIT